jgi:transposase
LDEEDLDWRHKSIVIIDNAGYHKSKFVRDKISQMKIPLMFLGPYQFRLAPIEIFFSQIKRNDLNPYNATLTSR